MGSNLGADEGGAVTPGIIAIAAVAGALAAGVITAGATQIAVDATQPNETSANVDNVSQPSYAD